MTDRCQRTHTFFKEVNVKKVIIGMFIVLIGLSSAHADQKSAAVFFKKTVTEGSHVRIPLDTAAVKRVIIQLQNLLDSESVVYRSEFNRGKERPENEIGPKKFRTYTLKPRITDEAVARKLDRKTIVLDTAAMDEIFIKVEKGSITIEVSEEKKKI